MFYNISFVNKREIMLIKFNFISVSYLNLLSKQMSINFKDKINYMWQFSIIKIILGASKQWKSYSIHHMSVQNTSV